jgi:hypothetical protein
MPPPSTFQRKIPSVLVTVMLEQQKSLLNPLLTISCGCSNLFTYFSGFTSCLFYQHCLLVETLILGDRVRGLHTQGDRSNCAPEQWLFNILSFANRQKYISRHDPEHICIFICDELSGQKSGNNTTCTVILYLPCD